MALPKSAKIVEVGPRDGLQNEPQLVPTEVKLEFIHRLSESGLKHIEATSFVSPQWVPQMADAADIMQVLKNNNSAHYTALVPNIKGLDAAISAGAKEIAVFGAASETFSQKNINCTIKESLKHFEKIINRASKNNIRVRGYVSCVLGCPYEGEVDLTTVVDIASTLFDMGCYEISLGDTIGVGTPKKAQALIYAANEKIPVDKLAVHFHDTYGQALANIFAAMECGVSVIDSAVGGLGGCPYAPGAAGNVATEDVLYMLNGMGIETGVDIEKVIAVAWYIANQIERIPASRIAIAKMNKGKLNHD